MQEVQSEVTHAPPTRYASWVDRDQKTLSGCAMPLRAVYAGDHHISEISSADLIGDYPAVRYYPPSGDLYFDVLTRLGDVASFEAIEAEIKEIDGTQVRVATPAALYHLKKNTIRLKDHADAAALRERFDLKDEG